MPRRSQETPLPIPKQEPERKDSDSYTDGGELDWADFQFEDPAAEAARLRIVEKIARAKKEPSDRETMMEELGHIEAERVKKEEKEKKYKDKSATEKLVMQANEQVAEIQARRAAAKKRAEEKEEEKAKATKKVIPLPQKDKISPSRSSGEASTMIDELAEIEAERVKKEEKEKKYKGMSAAERAQAEAKDQLKEMQRKQLEKQWKERAGADTRKAEIPRQVEREVEEVTKKKPAEVVVEAAPKSSKRKNLVAQSEGDIARENENAIQENLYRDLEKDITQKAPELKDDIRRREKLDVVMAGSKDRVMLSDSLHKLTYDEMMLKKKIGVAKNPAERLALENQLGLMQRERSLIWKK